MNSHVQILQLVIAYTLTGAFIFTVIVSCLSLVGWVKFADLAQQRKLFYVLIIELVLLCIGFFAGLLRFDLQSVANNIQRQTELHGDVAKAIGLVDFSDRANDYLSNMSDLIQDAEKEMMFSGISFYITVPEHSELLLQKVKEGVHVRFLVFDYINGDLKDVAEGFAQTPEQVKSECISTMLGLEEIEKALVGHSNAQKLEVKLFRDPPGARFYLFDQSLSRGRMFFIPHVNGINSPNAPGLLFTNIPSGFATLYAPSIERLWNRSTELNSWRNIVKGDE